MRFALSTLSKPKHGGGYIEGCGYTSHVNRTLRYALRATQDAPARLSKRVAPELKN